MTGSAISVVGAGSWGTVLAALLAKGGHRVRLWALEPEVAGAIRSSRTNPIYLPTVRLPEGLSATSDLGEAVSGCDVLVSAVPSQFARAVMTTAAAAVPGDALLVSATKGIETRTLQRMDEVFSEVFGPDVDQRFAVLSGPSFATEVAREDPTAVVAACADEEVARRVQSLFQTGYFRVYTNSDVVGVELGGALKNVIALAAGAAAGLGLGHNALAALITRGLAEMTRLGVALGARASTFAGLAGLGDLVLTCTGELSRNRTVGYRLGRGESLAAVLGDMRQVAEGVETVRAVHELARREGIEMPITEEVHAMLVEGREARQALHSLLSRDPKPEEWG